MSREKGFEAESVACEHLAKNGYKILDRNYNTRFGEIDIVAFKDGALRFFEVKSGSGFEPILNITESKLQKIIKSVHIYLSAKKLTLPYSIDAIILKNNQIEILENLTL